MNRSALAKIFNTNTQITRGTIFGSGAEKSMPLHLRENADTMFAGYVGKTYEPGGIVLFGVNPGGGGDTYDRRSYEDPTFYPLLQAFKVLESIATL